MSLGGQSGRGPGAEGSRGLSAAPEPLPSAARQDPPSWPGERQPHQDEPETATPSCPGQGGQRRRRNSFSRTNRRLSTWERNRQLAGSDYDDTMSMASSVQTRSQYSTSFNGSDGMARMATTGSRRERRMSRQICADQLHHDGAGSQPTHQAIEQLLRQEGERLARRISSRAYENDTEGVLLEKVLRRSSIRARSASPCKLHLKQSVRPGASSAVLTETDMTGVSPQAHQSALVRQGSNLSGNSIGPKWLGMSSLASEGLEENENTRYLGWVSPIKWFVTFLCAVMIASLATIIIMGSHVVSAWKVQMINNFTRTFGGGTGHLYAFAFLLAYGLPCCIFTAVLVTYLAPHAGGSGIPEIKAYLNGINMPQAFTFKTWFCRSLGLFLVTSSGMFAGTEGPFAHLGGIVASGFSNGPPTMWERGWWPRVLHGHRNRCEFISQGAAMGVAAAFGAPVGGILFSLEEASSYWSKTLTWQAFFGTMVAAVLAKFFKSGFQSISGSGFIEFPDKDATFENWELFTFAGLGLVTGLVGAVFCNSVRVTLKLRRRVFQLGNPTTNTRRMRLLEVACVVVLTAIVCLWPAVAVGCTPLPVGEAVPEERRLLGGEIGTFPDITGGICPAGEFSTLGYILLSPKEQTIKTLFSEHMADGATMTTGMLLAAFVAVWGTTIVTFGTAMPVGLFIPNILAGACLGRAAGQQLLDVGVRVHPGVYALIGAAGALAGFSRVTISLAVIFLEITNNMNLLLPLMLVIMTSKQVADRFGPSVYDLVLEANPEVHLLEDSLSEDHLLILSGLSVHDVATTEVVVVRAFEPMDKVMSLLLQTAFSAYPVTDGDGCLIGLMSRTKLLTLVEHHAEHIAPGELLALMPIAESAPEVTHWDTPIVRSFRHFRSSGLQHLCVVDSSHKLLGMLTRTDFAKLCKSGHEGVEEIREIFHRKQAAAALGQLVSPSNGLTSDLAHFRKGTEDKPAEHSSDEATTSGEPYGRVA